MFQFFTFLASLFGQSLTTLWQAALLFSPLAAAAVAVLGTIVAVALIRDMQQRSRVSATISPTTMQPTLGTAPLSAPYAAMMDRPEAALPPWQTLMQTEMQRALDVQWVIGFCEQILAQVTLSQGSQCYWTEMQALKEALAADTAQGGEKGYQQIAFLQYQARFLLTRLLDEVSLEITRQNTRPCLMPMVEVLALLEAGKTLWSDVIACAAQSSPDALLPYIEESNRQHRQATRALLNSEQRAQFSAHLLQAIKQWSAEDALLTILNHSKDLADPVFSEQRFAQFSQALLSKVDRSLKLFAQSVQSERASSAR